MATSVPGLPQVNTDPFPNNGVNSQVPSTKVFARYTPLQGGIEKNTGGGQFTIAPNTASIVSFSSGGGGQNIALFPFSPLITSTTFDNSVYNALINNFNENRANSFLMDVDYLNSPTIPVNQNAIINGTAKKAQVPDSNYTSKQVIIPRYLGSKITSANYNFPTPAGRVGPNTGKFIRPSVLPSFLNGDTGSWQGDSSYGNTAAIDKNPIYFAHFRTSTENENLPGTYTFNIDSLIEAPFESVLGKDFFPKIIKIDGSNQNLSSTVSTFEVNRKATISYNNTIANRINYSTLPIGDNVIYQGGLEFDNIIWNLNPTTSTPEANPTMSFQNGPTSINILEYQGTGTSGLYPKRDGELRTNFDVIRTMDITTGLFVNFLGGNGIFSSIDPNTKANIITPTDFIFNNFQNVYGYTKRDLSVVGISATSFSGSTWLVSGSTNLFSLDGSITSSGANITGSVNLTPIGVTGSNLDGTKHITASFTFSDTASLQSVSFSASEGNWQVGEQCFFTSQSMGATEPGGVGFSLILIKQNFENNRKGFFSLGGPLLQVSSSRGTGGIQSGNSTGNIFQGTSLAVIHTINQSVKNQIPFVQLPEVVTGETKSFGLPNGVNIDPNDPRNYIRYDVTQTILDNGNTTLSNYKDTKEPFLIEVGDEIKISYDTTENGVTSINNATFEVINVPNNGFDDGNIEPSGSVLVNGKLRLINNLPVQPQNVFYRPNGEPIPGRANLLYQSIIPGGAFGIQTGFRSSTNCFDRLEVTPNPQDLNSPIPEGKINNLQIIRRINADDRVIIFQVAPSGSEGVNTPSGPGFIVPNDLTSVQKLNVESLISLLNEKNTFKDEIPGRDEGLTS